MKAVVAGRERDSQHGLVREGGRALRWAQIADFLSEWLTG